MPSYFGNEWIFNLRLKTYLRVPYGASRVKACNLETEDVLLSSLVMAIAHCL